MTLEQHADVVLTNARVLNPDLTRPDVDLKFVAVKAGKIAGIGSAQELPRFKGPITREIDCQGMTLAPGFIDAHCHFLALASALIGLDCGPESVSGITELVQKVALEVKSDAAQPFTRQRESRWIKAYGYDEFYLREKRHPTRWDLDRAAPGHPVRLDHRTGHATVLNSQALELVGISKSTADPVDGVIERDGSNGEPTGVLYEMGRYLREAAQGYSDEEEFLQGVELANDLLLSKGITSIQDAGPNNDINRWRTFERFKNERRLDPRVTMMVGASHVKSFLNNGLTPRSERDGLKVGAAKIMLTLTTGAIQPQRDELLETVRWCHERGFQVAIHAVEEEAVLAAAEAIHHAQNSVSRADRRHRIEHCSECPPDAIKKLQASGAMVVTQPSFIYHSGDRYLSQVEDRLVPHLYPANALSRAGIRVAAGSDAPVTKPDPMLSIYAAVTRRTRGGETVVQAQRVSLSAAFRMHTLDAAYGSFDERNTGSIEVGKAADLVLLDGDPTYAEPESLGEIKVQITIVGGEVVWEPDSAHGSSSSV